MSEFSRLLDEALGLRTKSSKRGGSRGPKKPKQVHRWADEFDRYTGVHDYAARDNRLKGEARKYAKQGEYRPVLGHSASRMRVLTELTNSGKTSLQPHQCVASGDDLIRPTMDLTDWIFSEIDFSEIADTDPDGTPRVTPRSVYVNGKRLNRRDAIDLLPEDRQKTVLEEVARKQTLVGNGMDPAKNADAFRFNRDTGHWQERLYQVDLDAIRAAHLAEMEALMNQAPDVPSETVVTSEPEAPVVEEVVVAPVRRNRRRSA